MKYESIKIQKNHKFYNTGVNYQIKAIKDFGNVRKGDLGGYVDNRYNLSQKGDCWIYDNGRVSDNGLVYNNGRVSDNGKVFGNGIVCDNGIVCGNGKVSDNGIVYNYGEVCDNGIVCGNGKVFDNGRVCDNGEVFDNGRIFGNGIVCGNGRIDCKISGNYVCNETLIYPKLYRYKSYPIFDTKGEKPTHIKMGCFIKTIKEWKKDFYNNNIEFPKGATQTKQRLWALNYILMTLGEELIKE